MRRLVCAALILSLLFTGCATQGEPEKTKYTATFLTLFDTVTTIVGYSESKAEFEATSQQIHDELEYYHCLFDVYNNYEGINNLKTVNDNAGIGPVEVEEPIIHLLQDCGEYYALTDGMMNVAMGSVLVLWHEARNAGIDDPVNAKLPNQDALEEAAQYMDFSKVIVDAEQGTVWISDANVRLDVGAVAKGWAVQRAAEHAPEGLLISVGGNVVATGPKDAAGTPWVVGVQDPHDMSANLHTLYISGGSVVTSGDYQRGYEVDGEFYHHIIDPQTLFPSGYWSSVTIICPDSGLADALSTALFLLPLDEGQELLNQTGALAMWVDAEGNVFYSPGFEDLIRT